MVVPWSWSLVCVPGPLLAGPDNRLLQLVEEHLSVDTPECVDAVPRRTPASTLKRKQVVVVPVSAEALQGPADRLSPRVVEDQLHLRHLDLPCASLLSAVVDVCDVEDTKVGAMVGGT